MRYLVLAGFLLASAAFTGCASTRPDAKTMATPKKKTAMFCCPGTGPCVAQGGDDRSTH